MKTFKLMLIVLVGMNCESQAAEEGQSRPVKIKEKLEEKRASYLPWVIGTPIVTGIVGTGGAYVASRHGYSKAWNEIKTAIAIPCDKALETELGKTVSKTFHESIKPKFSNGWNTASAIATPILSHPATPAFLTLTGIATFAFCGQRQVHHVSGAKKEDSTEMLYPGGFDMKSLARCNAGLGLGTALGTAWTLKNLGYDLSTIPALLGATAAGAVVGTNMYCWLAGQARHSGNEKPQGYTAEMCNLFTFKKNGNDRLTETKVN